MHRSERNEGAFFAGSVTLAVLWVRLAAQNL
jgi:hypothetical protein